MFARIDQLVSSNFLDVVRFVRERLALLRLQGVTREDLLSLKSVLEMRLVNARNSMSSCP
jgi:hypothetical protein